MREPVSRQGAGGRRAPVSALPLQDRLDRATQYFARYGMALIAVVVVAMVSVRLVEVDFPGFRAILDGRDILSAQDNPNYVRNLLELVSFLATSGVLATALWAFAFTKTQIKEAKDTRLATLYATLESRWASEEMLRSKALFAQITYKYMDYRSAAEAKGAEARSLPEFAHDFIMDLQKSHQYEYFTLMSLPEYLEYIGMLERQGYLIIDDINYILGVVCIEVTSTLKVHIEYLRQIADSTNAENSMPGAPREFDCLTYLAEEFLKRYRMPTTSSP